MPIDRYVTVSDDLSNTVILNGPYLWDGLLTTWAPPAGTHSLLEADALSKGYTWPPPEYIAPDE
jgi:hypothetical protein